MNEELFWSNVTKTETCWVWRNYRNRYGTFNVDGKNQPAHRVAYEITYGPIPPKLVVRHRCDNAACVRPEHLQLGTVAENIRDQMARGRKVRQFRIRSVVLDESGELVSIVRILAVQRKLRIIDFNRAIRTVNVERLLQTGAMVSAAELDRLSLLFDMDQDQLVENYTRIIS